MVARFVAKSPADLGRVFLFAWLTVWLAAAQAAAAPRQDSKAATSSEPLAELDRFFEARAAEGLAFVAMVVQGGETVFAQAYGEANRKRGEANGVATAFDVGSVSKTFTAAAVYRLASEGKLDLEAPISRYFEEVPEDKALITIDHLLNHRSGLPQYHDRGDFERLGRAKAEARIFGLSLARPPGSDYGYSNAGYTLLAILVEKISGEPFREHLRRHFLDPLGLTRTGFYGEAERWGEGGVATGYGDDRQGKNNPAGWRSTDLWALLGNGGMVSTAEDLIRWMAGSQRYFPEPDPPADLGKARFFRDGWYLRHRPTTGLQIFHGGASDKGFISMARTYPESRLTLVLLSNTFRSGEPHIRSHLDAIEDLLFAPSGAGHP